MLSELLAYAKDSPLLLAAVVASGTALAVVERVFALSGPVTRLAEWWSGRELAKLRREAAVRAEKRRIAAEEESAVVTGLRRQVAALEAELERRASGTAPMPRTRNQPRVPEPRR